MTSVGGARPAPNRPAAQTTVTDPAIERSRRRWKLHRQFTTARKISAALDAKCGIERPDVEIDYHATGLDLGYAERRAAGIALLKLERAA